MKTLFTSILEKKMEMFNSVAALIFLICMFFAVSSQNAYAQNPRNGLEAAGITIPTDARVVVVEPDNYPSEVGNLNRAVESELTDDKTVFELKRDGVYWTDTRIENADYRLIIRAQEGEGNPPHVRPAVDLGASVEMINSTRDVILQGIMFQGLNEDGAPEEILIHSGEDAVIVVDSCWFVGSFAYIIRTLGSNNSIYATNNIIHSSGRNANDQNGRFIECAGNPQDTVYVENNTCYNMGHSFVRSSGGALLGYLHLNHNTVMNISQYTWAGAVKHMNITNNIFRNVYTIGEDEAYDVRGWITITQLLEGESERVLVYNYNNSAYLDEEFYPLIEERNAFHTDANIIKAPDICRLYSNENDSLAPVTYENNIEEKIDFADPPEVDSIYLDWTKQWMMGRDGVPFGGDPQPNTYYDHFIPFDHWNETTTYLGVAPGHFSVDLVRNFTYSSDYQSYTAAEEGFPLGDLNWFPELKERWIQGLPPTSIEETETIPADFHIIGNYPNPFNPSTTIVYEIASQTKVKMEVFNVIGQSIKTIDMGVKSPGRHEFTFDAGDITSGVYLIRMQTGNDAKVQTHRVMLLK